MNSAANVAELKRLLSQTDERASLAARLRPLMPYLQTCVDTGLPYAALLDDLALAGLPIKPRLLERSLYRWRKARRLPSHQPEKSPAYPADEPGKPDDAVAETHITVDQAIQGRPRRIETPGDLRQIRDMHIDLEALRREGEALRKAQQHKERARHPSSPSSSQESSS